MLRHELSVEVLTPAIAGAPGEQVIARIVIQHGADRPIDVQVRVLGVRVEATPREVGGGLFPPGVAIEIEVPIVVPADYGIGRHPIALEVTSNDLQHRPVLVHVDVRVASVRNVVITPRPAIVRGRRSVAFDIDIENREHGAVDLVLTGDGAEVTASFSSARLRLQQSERANVRVRLRGPRLVTGEPIQRLVTLTARGRANSTSTTVRYVQRPLVPWRLRTVLAALTVIALFVIAGVVVIPQIDQRRVQDGAKEAAGAAGSTNSDGSTPSEESAGSDGSGASGDTSATGGSGATGSEAGASGPGPSGTGGVDDTDTAAAGTGGESTDGGSDAVDSGTRKKATALYGTIKLSDGANAAGVQVLVTAIGLDARAPAAATLLGAPAGAHRPAKIWSARASVPQPQALGSVRITEAIAPVSSKLGGEWFVDGVKLRQSYEVVFTKLGYDPKSFVVSPPESGERVQLDVELTPATGSIAGTVVDDGGRALGGASLEITGGNIRATTTSNTSATAATASTDTAGVGAFSFSALSPAVYTITVRLAGYGTEVRQYTLKLGGEPLTRQDIPMQRGVGSIEGNITLNGNGTGGVLVTATLGATVFRTTSLTDGSGHYVLPRVPISKIGDYTVTASVAGASRQTRRQMVGGAEAGVDFSLVTSTGGIAGLVVDSRGAPIVGARVTITRDDIEFVTRTAGEEARAGFAAPVAFGGIAAGYAFYLRAAAGDAAGQFVVRELPPGRYVVTVDQYLHRSSSIAVAVVAGPFAPLPTPIVLEDLPPTGDAVGTLVVQAVDEETEALISNATFSVRSETYAPPQRPETTPPDGAPDVFEQSFVLPVGTYTLVVRKAGYRDEVKRVSVGPGTTRWPVVMRPKGPLTITVVDRSLGGVPVQLDSGLTIVVRNVNDGTLVLRGSVVHEETGSKVYWETESAVDNGTWQIEVLNHPDGFFVPAQLPENVAAEHVPAGTRMVFRIDRDSPSQLDIVLAAQSYPEVRTTLYRPTGNGTTVARLDEPTTTTVVLVCPAGSVALSPVQTATGRDPGSYRLSPEVVQGIAADPTQLGACHIDAASPGSGLAPRTITFSPPLALGTFTARRDHQIRTSLIPPTPTVTGTVFWLADPTDPTSRIDVHDVPISAEAVVTGYTEDQTINGRTPNVPGALQAEVGAVWNADGTFTLARQVFGTVAYTITADNIAPGVFLVAVPPTPTLVTPTAGLVTTSVPDADPNDDASRYDMQLTDPEPGTIGGCLERETLTPDEPFTSFGIDAFPPGATSPAGVVEMPAPASVVLPAGCDGSFGLAPAMAGNWRVAFRPPPNYVLATPQPTPFSVPAGGAVIVPTPRFVELATITLSVRALGSTTALPVIATVTGGLLASGASLGGAVTDLAHAIASVPVDVAAVEPTTAFQAYQLAIAVDGYDTLGASVTIDGVPQGTGAAQDQQDATSIPIRVAAGSNVVVVVTLPQFGTISGSVTGIRSYDIVGTADDEGRTSPVVVPPSPRVQVRRVTDLGADIIGEDWTDATIATGTTDFTFTGRAGSYRIQITHADYQTWVNDVDGSGLTVLANGNAAGLGTIGIRPRPGTLALTVLQSIGGPGVAVANVRLYRRSNPLFAADQQDIVVLIPGGGIPFGAVVRGTAGELTALGVTEDGLAIALTDAAGSITLSGLVPGDYWLELRLTGLRGDGSTGDLYYPVMAAITIPLGATDGDTTLTAIAVMPPQAGSISLTVHVVNEDFNGELFPGINFVPVPSDISVRRTFTPPPLQVMPGQSPGTTLAPNTIASTQVALMTVTAQEATLAFGNLPAGVHTLDITMPAGYTQISPAGPLNVDVDTGVAAITVTYSVSNVDLVVLPTDVDGDSILDADRISATLSFGGAPGGTTVGLDADGRLRFRNVAPRAVPYSITVDSDLHVATTVTNPVSPTTGTCTGIPILPCHEVAVPNIAAAGSRITGRFSLLDSPGASLGNVPAGNARIDVLNVSGTIIASTVSEPYNGVGGVYSLDVPSPPGPTRRATYTVRATLADAGSGLADPWNVNSSTYTIDQIAVPVRAGRTARSQNLVLQLKPLVIVTIANPPSTASVEILQPGTGIVPVKQGNTWRFRILPGVPYRFHARGDDASQYYYPIDVPATADPYVFGSTTNLSAPLATRAVTVSVTRVGSSPMTANVTLEVLDTNADPAVLSTATLLATDASNVAVEARFPLVGATLPLRIAGVARATVTANGYRTVVDTAAAAQRSATINIRLRPNVSLTGSISPAQAGVSVVATSPTNEPKIATTTSSGAFDFAGQGNFGNGVWTIDASVLGTGAIASQTFTVTGGSVSIAQGSTGLLANGVDGLVANALVLAPRTINLALTAFRPGTTANPLTGWTLQPVVSTPTLEVVGPNATFKFKESGTVTYDFDVVHGGSLTERLSLTITAADLGTDREFHLIRVVPLFQAPVITGTATPPTGNVNGATVTLFAGACGPTGTAPRTTSVAGGGFTFDQFSSAVAEGSHCVRVVEAGGATGRLTITVTKNASGFATVSHGSTTPTGADTITVDVI